MINNIILSDYREKIEVMYAELISLPEEIVTFIPDLESAWSIEEHLRHLLDVELNQFLLINEDIKHNLNSNMVEVQIKKVDDFQELLTIYKNLRNAVYEILKREDFIIEKCRIKSSVHGIIELESDDGMKALNNHLDTHKGYITRNLTAYESLEDVT